jgi:hypothetical protein
MSENNSPSDRFPKTNPMWLNPEEYPEEKHHKFIPAKGSPPERLGSQLDFALSILQFRQYLEPVLNLYKAAEEAEETSGNVHSFSEEKKAELAKGFGNLFREIYNARLSALPKQEIKDHLFIDEATLNRLKMGQATYEEALDIFEPLFFLLEEISDPGKLQ